MFNKTERIHMQLRPEGSDCIGSLQLALASRAEDQHSWQTGALILARFHDVKFTLDQFQLPGHPVLDLPRPMIPGEESDDEDSALLDGF
jgi:hypothetical protein